MGGNNIYPYTTIDVSALYYYCDVTVTSDTKQQIIFITKPRTTSNRM